MLAGGVELVEATTSCRPARVSPPMASATVARLATRRGQTLEMLPESSWRWRPSDTRCLAAPRAAGLLNEATAQPTEGAGLPLTTPSSPPTLRLCARFVRVRLFTAAE